MAFMQIGEFDKYIRGILDFETTASIDPSLNGIQFGREDKTIEKAAFAVDACEDSIRRAGEWGADILFVHHGLFWGTPLAVRRSHYSRLQLLFHYDLALYAVHLPLDVHPRLGNNAGIAEKAGLQDLVPFGTYRGKKIGYKGSFSSPKTSEQVLYDLGLDRDTALAFLPFGKEEVITAAAISGGGVKEVEEAIQEGMDIYITGDVSHQVYHLCKESKINMISGGHYHTEIWGVKRMSENVHRERGLETCFIDVPTGL